MCVRANERAIVGFFVVVVHFESAFRAMYDVMSNKQTNKINITYFCFIRIRKAMAIKHITFILNFVKPSNNYKRVEHTLHAVLLYICVCASSIALIGFCVGRGFTALPSKNHHQSRSWIVSATGREQSVWDLNLGLAMIFMRTGTKTQ